MSRLNLIGVPGAFWQAAPALAEPSHRALQISLCEWRVLERRLAKTVNLQLERPRYTVCCEQVELQAAVLASQVASSIADLGAAQLRQVASGGLPALQLPADYLDWLNATHVMQAATGAIDPSLGRSIFSPEQVARASAPTAGPNPPAVVDRQQFVQLLADEGWGLVECPADLQPDLATARTSRAQAVVEADVIYDRRDDLFIMERYLRRGLSWGEANLARLREQVRLALPQRGRFYVQNQGHEATTRVLCEFVQAASPAPPSAVRIVYRDGSEGRPFPMRCLRPATLPRERRFDLPIALMSMRHLELDWHVQGVWFRNMEGSGGSSTAEDDERLYELSVERLSELRQAFEGRPLWLRLFHTGLETAIIGFYRALVESLLPDAQAGREPWIVVQPSYFRKEGTFDTGPTWPAAKTREVAPV